MKVKIFYDKFSYGEVKYLLAQLKNIIKLNFNAGDYIYVEICIGKDIEKEIDN